MKAFEEAQKLDFEKQVHDMNMHVILTSYMYICTYIPSQIIMMILLTS